MYLGSAFYHSQHSDDLILNFYGSFEPFTCTLFTIGIKGTYAHESPSQLMNIQPPPISPRQMNLLRVVLSMAWADNSLEQKEVSLMLDRFSRLFATDPEQQTYLQQQLQEYFVQDIPLEEAVAKLTNDTDKEIVLRLSYEVIHASARTPKEATVNDEESQAYKELVSLLNLPSDTVKRAEKEARAYRQQGGKNIVDMLAYQLREYLVK